MSKTITFKDIKTGGYKVIPKDKIRYVERVYDDIFNANYGRSKIDTYTVIHISGGMFDICKFYTDDSISTIQYQLEEN